MKSGFFIMKLWQTGNIGSHNITKIDENPEEGFSSYEEAKTALFEMYSKNKNLIYGRMRSLSIMELFFEIRSTTQ